jgi:anti-sigma-K factor RskA
MNRDELEFSIVQYLDGTLDPAARAEVELRLATDVAARAMLDEHRRLTAVLRSQRLPEVRWDRLAASISDAIDEQAEERMARVSWILSFRAAGYVAAAASVMLAVALVVYFLRSPRPTNTIVSLPQPQPQVALSVQGPQEDQPAGPPVEEVSIGPGGSYANASPLAPYADEVDTRPTRVALAAAAGPVASEQSEKPSPF